MMPVEEEEQAVEAEAEEEEQAAAVVDPVNKLMDRLVTDGLMDGVVEEEGD